MEATSLQLQAKFSGGRSIFAHLERAAVVAPAVQSLQAELQALETRYALTTCQLFMSAAAGGAGRALAREEFQRLVASEGFLQGVDSVMGRAAALLNRMGYLYRDNAIVPAPVARTARKTAGGRKPAGGRAASRAAADRAGDCRMPAMTVSASAATPASEPARDLGGTATTGASAPVSARVPPPRKSIVPPAPAVSAARASASAPPEGCTHADAAPPDRMDAGVSTELQRLLDMYPAGIEAGGLDPAGRSKDERAPPRSYTVNCDYEHCGACGIAMTVDPDRAELRCLSCNVVRELDGTVFDEAQYYSQEGQKAKSGSFNPNRHFQFWWSHICAREPEEELGDSADPDNMYGEKLLASMAAMVKRKSKILRFLTVEDVRQMLHELDRTDLNKNASLLLKKLTGVGPPHPPDALSQRVERLFTTAIEIGEQTQRPGRSNRDYYGFYIMKILDAILEEGDREMRRLLYYIYIQGADTVTNDDADWERICELMLGLVYVPTDRRKMRSYRPE
jgi:hypothetical protein